MFYERENEHEYYVKFDSEDFTKQIRFTVSFKSILY